MAGEERGCPCRDPAHRADNLLFPLVPRSFRVNTMVAMSAGMCGDDDLAARSGTTSGEFRVASMELRGERPAVYCASAALRCLEPSRVQFSLATRLLETRDSKRCS